MDEPSVAAEPTVRGLNIPRKKEGHLNRRSYSSDRPSRMQYFVRPAVVRIPSLSMICLRWVSTVLTLTLRLAAISLVDLPSAMSCKTCNSRLVSLSACVKPFGARRPDPSPKAAALVIVVLKYTHPFTTGTMAVHSTSAAERVQRD